MGSVNSSTIVSHHASVLMGDDILRQFWEIEEKPDLTAPSLQKSVWC